MRIAVEFAYNGKKFHGYARQPNIDTIEGKIVESLVKNDIIENTRDSCFQSASRTDKGVSAFCNVIAFNTNISNRFILQELSNDFSDSIFYGFKIVPSDFNPRYAKKRWYRYYLNINNCNLIKLMISADLFTGENNFSNFARVEDFKNPVRRIDNIVFSKKDNFLIIDFFAQTFLWHQIRRIISSILKVEKGKIEMEDIRNALENPGKKVDFGLAPAEPLILYDIFYDFKFEYDKERFDELIKLENRILKDLDISLVESPKSKN